MRVLSKACDFVLSRQLSVARIIAIVFAFLILNSAFIIPVYAQQATMNLTPSSGTYNPGCQFTTSLNLNTGGAQTDGTDAILVYDTSRLSTNSNSIASGTIYPDYPGNNVDEATGRITISGLSSITSAFSGSGTLATITFTVLPQAPVGVATVNFDFDANDKSKTTDSNVVERGTVTDILSTVVNGNYTIGTGTACANGGSVVPTGNGISTPSGGLNDGSSYNKTLPPAGTEQLTYTIAIVGTTLVILGILGFALL